MGMYKQESGESSMSESLLSPRRDGTVAEADSGFLSPSVMASVADTQPSSTLESVKEETPERWDSQQTTEHVANSSLDSSIEHDVDSDHNAAAVVDKALDSVKPDSDSGNCDEHIDVVNMDTPISQEYAQHKQTEDCELLPDKSDSEKLQNVLSADLQAAANESSDSIEQPDSGVGEQADDTTPMPSGLHNTSTHSVHLAESSGATSEKDNMSSTDADNRESKVSVDSECKVIQNEDNQASTSCENVPCLSIENGFLVSSELEQQSEADKTTDPSLEEGEIDISMEVEPSSEAADSSNSPNKVETCSVESRMDESGVSTSEQLVSCSSGQDSAVDNSSSTSHEADAHVHSSEQSEGQVQQQQEEIEEGELSEVEADVSQDEISASGDQHLEVKDDACGNDFVSSSSNHGGIEALHQLDTDHASSLSEHIDSPQQTASSNTNTASSETCSMDNDAAVQPSCSSSSPVGDDDEPHHQVDSTWHMSSADCSSNQISSSSNGCTDYPGGDIVGPSSSSSCTTVCDTDREAATSKQEPCSSSAVADSEDLYISGTPHRDTVSSAHSLGSSSSSSHSKHCLSTDTTAAPSSILSPSSSFSSSSLFRSSFSSSFTSAAASASTSVNSSSPTPTTSTPVPPAKKKVCCYLRSGIIASDGSTQGSGGPETNSYCTQFW